MNDICKWLEIVSCTEEEIGKYYRYSWMSIMMSVWVSGACGLGSSCQRVKWGLLIVAGYRHQPDFSYIAAVWLKITYKLHIYDFLAYTPAQAGTRFSDPEECKAELTLVLVTFQDSLPEKDGNLAISEITGQCLGRKTNPQPKVASPIDQRATMCSGLKRLPLVYGLRKHYI